jgi:hypothetical protein
MFSRDLCANSHSIDEWCIKCLNMEDSSSISIKFGNMLGFVNKEQTTLDNGNY